MTEVYPEKSQRRVCLFTDVIYMCSPFLVVRDSKTKVGIVLHLFKILAIDSIEMTGFGSGTKQEALLCVKLLPNPLPRSVICEGLVEVFDDLQWNL